MVSAPSLAKEKHQRPGLQPEALLYIVHESTSGIPSPGWSVMTQDEVDYIMALTKDLPSVGEPGAQFEMGSFVIMNKDALSFSSNPAAVDPIYINVFKGIVTIKRGIDKPRYFKDEKGLEVFLQKEESKKAVSYDKMMESK